MRLTRRGWALPAGVRQLAAALLLACCAGERARAQFVGIDFNSPARLVFGATQLAEALLDQSVSKVVIHGAPRLCPAAAASPLPCARRAWLRIVTSPVQCNLIGDCLVCICSCSCSCVNTGMRAGRTSRPEPGPAEPVWLAPRRHHYADASDMESAERHCHLFQPPGDARGR
jgi:hypothetical protein